MPSPDQDKRDLTSVQDGTDRVTGSQNERDSSAPSTQSLQSSDAGSSPNPPPSSPRTDAPSSIGGSSSSTGVLDRNSSGISQDLFESSTVPSNPLSYNLISKVNSASGSPPLSISSPTLKIVPPMPPSALQPPVPGQVSLSRPSFSYNINPDFNQQVQPFPPTGNMNLPKKIAMPSVVTPSLQQSVSGRTLGLSSNLSDSVKQNTSAVAQLTLPENISHNGTALVVTVNSLEKEPSSMSNSAMITPLSSALQSTSSVPHIPTGFNPNIPPSPHMSVPSFRGPSSSRPILQSPALTQQNHPNFPLINPSPQAIWMHPSHAGHHQHRPFGPYNGSIPAFPMGMQNMPPHAHFPNLRPPGISGPVSSMVVQPTGNELVQAGKDFGAQSVPLCGDNAAETSSKTFDVVKHDEANAWTSHRTETGAVYYYNRITGQSTYEKPSCFAGEPRKADAQPTPFSWEKIAGTDWTLVTTSDGKKYYYNNTTKVSSWQIPPDVLERKKNPENEPLKGTSTSQIIIRDYGSVQTDIHDVTSSKAGSLVSPSALDLIKKKLHDSSSSLALSSPPTVVDLTVSGAVDAPVKSQPNESNKEKEKDANRDGNATESSSDSDEETNGPSKEECIVQFKKMLKERGVAPFSKWEKELPKILFDPRFKAVESHSLRRSLFEHYVRTRAEEERKEKRVAQKALIDGFKQLLDDALEDINVKTDYQDFKRKWGDDPRFLALGRKEREVLLNERIACLKKEDEEKIQVLCADFKSMLRESPLITATSRWSRVKDTFRDDPRYRSVKRDDREVFFNEYMSELKAVEDEVHLASKAKMEEHEKLKKREEEMRKKKQREEQEMEAVRLRVRRKQAESSYQALLVEKIKDPKASWTESKPKLEKDPQERAKNPDLSSHDMEKLFREHIKNLLERCARDYQALLSEIISMEMAEKAATTSEGKKTILSSWSEAKSLLRSDPRYSKMPSKEREMLWSRYVDDLRRKLHMEAGVEEGSKKRMAVAVNDGGGSSPKRRQR